VVEDKDFADDPSAGCSGWATDHGRRNAQAYRGRSLPGQRFKGWLAYAVEAARKKRTKTPTTSLVQAV
jgi:hypothetical protein